MSVGCTVAHICPRVVLGFRWIEINQAPEIKSLQSKKARRKTV